MIKAVYSILYAAFSYEQNFVFRVKDGALMNDCSNKYKISWCNFLVALKYTNFI
jgi:hypothetical protein